VGFLCWTWNGVNLDEVGELLREKSGSTLIDIKWIKCH
jgi:hypothetical protein